MATASDERALATYRRYPTIASAARIPSTTTTIISSTRVKPRERDTIAVFGRNSPNFKAHTASPSPSEGGHHLDVIRLRHEVQGHRPLQPQPRRPQPLRVPPQGLRIARHVDQPPPGQPGQ